jgi:tellurite methyltransferase
MMSRVYANVIFAKMKKSRKENLQKIYGNIDIYLFDQLLKGTYDHCEKILDAGCGEGRNLVYFLRSGFEIFGVDQQPEAIQQVEELAHIYAAKPLSGHFQVADITSLPFPDADFDLVISSAVLHFAENMEHFEAMLNEMWRVLKPGGYFFCRLASVIGIESSVHFIGNGRYIIPDESERFLVNQEMLIRLTKKMGGELHEPIKTTNVQNLRSMTTWCVQKQ